MRGWHMRKVGFLLGFLVVFVAGCNQVFFNPEPYRVRLDPTQWGYEVDEQGRIVIVGNNAVVEIAPGAPEGVLERYEYIYIDDSGNEVLPGASLGSGSVGLPFPSGREVVDGQVVYKWARSEPFRFSLDGSVAAEHLSQGAPLNWRARVIWYARLMNRQEISWTQEYQIKFPLK
jgi:hypothetical protein